MDLEIHGRVQMSVYLFVYQDRMVSLRYLYIYTYNIMTATGDDADDERQARLQCSPQGTHWCACSMEEPPKGNGQLPQGTDPELEPMMFEGDGEGKSHTMDDANGCSSMDVDRELFDSLGEEIVEPSYGPSDRGPEESHKPKLRHARLQNMTYLFKMKVEVNIQLYSMEEIEKAKTGNDHFGYKKQIMNDTHFINIGCLPVMVKSNLCWLHKLKESDCQFDLGGYFLIKGMDKSARFSYG
ncbi:hypothetical protein GUJ93_ZPchr0004g39030 [Zizania palustris]|uniref:DNA-directed RNA polymerase n=1 Tax=Zizania palustris TaxID=103762 RepID=A0A8J5VGJ2_ZIZPA|nr:hypothetical protein GUJ93_ZPchr0004g39030 [Zizania palustris]